MWRRPTATSSSGTREGGVTVRREYTLTEAEPEEPAVTVTSTPFFQSRAVLDGLLERQEPAFRLRITGTGLDTAAQVQIGGLDCGLERQEEDALELNVPAQMPDGVHDLTILTQEGRNIPSPRCSGVGNEVDVNRVQAGSVLLEADMALWLADGRLALRSVDLQDVLVGQETVNTLSLHLDGVMTFQVGDLAGRMVDGAFPDPLDLGDTGTAEGLGVLEISSGDSAYDRGRRRDHPLALAASGVRRGAEPYQGQRGERAVKQSVKKLPIVLPLALLAVLLLGTAVTTRLSRDTAAAPHRPGTEIPQQHGLFGGRWAEFMQSLSLDPTNEEARLGLAEAYLAMEETDLVPQVLQPLTENGNPEAYRVLAESQSQAQDTGGALVTAQTLVETTDEEEDYALRDELLQQVLAEPRSYAAGVDQRLAVVDGAVYSAGSNALASWAPEPTWPPTRCRGTCFRRASRAGSGRVYCAGRTSYVVGYRGQPLGLGREPLGPDGPELCPDQPPVGLDTAHGQRRRGRGGGHGGQPLRTQDGRKPLVRRTGQRSGAAPGAGILGGVVHRLGQQPHGGPSRPAGSSISTRADPTPAGPERPGRSRPSPERERGPGLGHPG